MSNLHRRTSLDLMVELALTVAHVITTVTYNKESDGKDEYDSHEGELRVW